MLHKTAIIDPTVNKGPKGNLSVLVLIFMLIKTNETNAPETKEINNIKSVNLAPKNSPATIPKWISPRPIAFPFDIQTIIPKKLPPINAPRN